MKKVISLLTIGLISVSLVGCGDDKLDELSTEEKLEDFNYYKNVMNENYCNFDVFYNEYNVEYESLYDTFEEGIKNSKDNEEFLKLMSDYIGLIGDGHTHLVHPSGIGNYQAIYNKSYPYHNRILSDEELIGTNKKWINYLDNKNKVYEEVSNKMYVKEDNVQSQIIDDIAYLKVNSFSQFSDDDLKVIEDLYKDIDKYDNYIIDIRGNGGGNNLMWVDHIITPIVNDVYESKTYELHKDGDITKEYYEDNYTELIDIKEFPDKEILDNVSNIDNFKYYSERNLKISNEALFEGGKDKPGYEGDIYLMVDKGSFSASEGLAVFCKNSGFATVVGNENSGGDGIGISPIVFSLPNSKLVIRTTTSKGLNEDGSSNLEHGTELDMYVNTLDDLIEYIKNK